MLTHEGKARSFSENASLAVALSGVAGAVNATGFFVGTYTSHVTGHVAAVGDEIAQGHMPLAFDALVLLVSFLLGAMTATVFVMGSRRTGGRGHYKSTLIPRGGGPRALHRALGWNGAASTRAPARPHGDALFRHGAAERPGHEDLRGGGADDAPHRHHHRFRDSDCPPLVLVPRPRERPRAPWQDPPAPPQFRLFGAAPGLSHFSIPSSRFLPAPPWARSSTCSAATWRWPCPAWCSCCWSEWTSPRTGGPRSRRRRSVRAFRLRASKPRNRRHRMWPSRSWQRRGSDRAKSNEMRASLSGRRSHLRQGRLDEDRRAPAPLPDAVPRAPPGVGRLCRPGGGGDGRLRLALRQGRPAPACSIPGRGPRDRRDAGGPAPCCLARGALPLRLRGAAPAAGACRDAEGRCLRGFQFPAARLGRRCRCGFAPHALRPPAPGGPRLLPPPLARRIGRG